MLDYIFYYFGVGYALNNLVALFALYGEEEDELVDIDFTNFIITIPAWPYTLYRIIASMFEKE